MSEPKGLFWAWNDIGSGPRWYVCQIVSDGEGPMIQYMDGDFTDYWNDDDWEEGQIIPIKPPDPLE